MYTIEESLDAILIELKNNWNNSGGRKYLKCEELLTKFGYPPDFRKHEFFMRLIDRLIKDDYAEFTTNEQQTRSRITYYQEETLITVEGYYFITNANGGYKNAALNDERAENLRVIYENRLLYGTWGVAIGAVSLVAWEMIKFYYYEGHPLCH